MASTAPARKPYRKAPPQHRETRHALPVAPPMPASQLDINQVNQQCLNPPQPPPSYLTHLPGAAAKWPQSSAVPFPHLLSDSELDVSSLSSLEVCIPPPPRFSSHSQRSHWTRTAAAGVATNTQSPRVARKPKSSRSRHGEQQRSQRTKATAAAPRGILKQPASLGVEHAYDIIRKTKSVELLDDSKGRGSSGHHPPTHSLDRSEQRGLVSRRSSDPPSPCGMNWTWRTQLLEDKVRFSNFLDEITCQVLSPAQLILLGRMPPSREQGSPAPRHCHTARWKQPLEGTLAERTQRWNSWVAAMRRPGSLYKALQEEREGPLKGDVTEGAEPTQEVMWGSRGVKMEAGETREKQRHKHRPPASNQSPQSLLKVGSPTVIPPAPPLPFSCPLVTSTAVGEEVCTLPCQLS